MDRAVAARGEAIVLTARMSFTGEEGSPAGRSVVFEGIAGELGAFEPKTATTDAAGVAKTTLRLKAPDQTQSQFDELDGYEAKMAGGGAAGRVESSAVQGAAAVKAAAQRAGDALDEYALEQDGARPSGAPGEPLQIEGVPGGRYGISTSAWAKMFCHGSSVGRGEAMNVLKADARKVLVELTRDDLVLLANSIGEALNAIDDWEFPIRAGYSVANAENLHASIAALLRGMPEK